MSIDAKVALEIARSVQVSDPHFFQQLAGWVVALLDDRPVAAHRVNAHDGVIYVSDPHPRMDGSHVKLKINARHARRLAAALIRAADETERGSEQT